MKIHILFLFTLLTSLTLKSQDKPVHEQYMTDYMLVNPSFTGLANITSVKLSHRQQWVGFSQAPFTSYISAKHRLRDREGGVGGYVYSDQNGPNVKYGVQLSGSFQVVLKNKRNMKQVLAFGLSFKGTYHTLDESKLDKDIYDPIIAQTVRSSFTPNANFGLLYATNSSFAGVSLDNLIPITDNIYSSLEQFERISINIHAGNILQFNDSRQLRSSIILKSDFNGMNQLDAVLRYHFLFSPKYKLSFNSPTDEFWVGLLYRQTLDKNNISPLAIAPAFGIKFGWFTLTYSYDIGLTSIQNYHYGTHQISIGIKKLHDDINWGRKKAMIFIDEF